MRSHCSPRLAALVLFSVVPCAQPCAAQSSLTVDGRKVALDKNVVLFDRPPLNPLTKPQIRSVIMPAPGAGASNVQVQPDAAAQGGYVEGSKDALNTSDLCITDRVQLYGPAGKADWGQLSQNCTQGRASPADSLGWTQIGGAGFGLPATQ